MRYVYLLLAFILGWIINAFFGVPLKAIYYLLPWYWWVIAGLAVAIFLLLFLIDGARRYHERTVDELTTDFETHAKNIAKLSFLRGRGLELWLLMGQGEPDTNVLLRRWAEEMRNALAVCYGSSARERFDGGRGYTVEVPRELSAQGEWLYQTVERLEDLIKDEQPPPEPIDLSHLPDDVYRSA